MLFPLGNLATTTLRKLPTQAPNKKSQTPMIQFHVNITNSGGTRPTIESYTNLTREQSNNPV